jgi:hypothetical protein
MGITIDRGQTYSGTITITQDGAAKDITGYTIFFTVKKNTNDLDDTDDDKALISKNITSHTNAAGGISLLSLTTSDTSINPGTYFYDIKLKNSEGSWVKYSATDKFTVRGVTTNRLS